jgi:hypothetical protein
MSGKRIDAGRGITQLTTQYISGFNIWLSLIYHVIEVAIRFHWRPASVGRIKSCNCIEISGIVFFFSLHSLFVFVQNDVKAYYDTIPAARLDVSWIHEGFYADCAAYSTKSFNDRRGA